MLKATPTLRFGQSYQRSIHSMHLRCLWHTFGFFTLEFFTLDDTRGRTPGIIFPHMFLIFVDLVRSYVDQEIQISLSLVLEYMWNSAEKNTLSLIIYKKKYADS